MTIPVSCLISAQQEISTQSSANINFMKNEFTQFLYNAKEAFLDLKITRIVLEHLNSLTLNVLLRIRCAFLKWLIYSNLNFYFAFHCSNRKYQKMTAS